MIRRMPAEGNIYIKNRIVILPICLAAAAEVSVAATSGNVTLALPQGGADVVYTSNSGRLHTGRSHERSGDIYVFGGEGRINVVTSSDAAAEWFHARWGVPKDAYLECMDSYLHGDTEYGRYLCLCGGRITGGLGVIENDFRCRKDLSPNICAVYTDPQYRCRGIAGELPDMAVGDLKAKGISPVYLLTDHTGFYERYGREFLCRVLGDDEEKPSRMYIRR